MALAEGNASRPERAKEGWDKTGRAERARRRRQHTAPLRADVTPREGGRPDPEPGVYSLPDTRTETARIPMSDGEEGDPILQRMFIRFPGPEERAMRSSREESKPEPKPTWVAPLQAHRFARRGRRAPRRLEEGRRRSLRLRVDRLPRGRPVDRAHSSSPVSVEHRWRGQHRGQHQIAYDGIRRRSDTPFACGLPRMMPR